MFIKQDGQCPRRARSAPAIFTAILCAILSGKFALARGGEPDCNNNGVPDSIDIANGTSPDCNDNGVPDACDVADGTSQDCNGNEVPDECETIIDCNSNGVPDPCDIANGTSMDCNNNGVPDECDNDCNSNGIPDQCDINGGGSEDCNGNGLPDECDIALGLSTDCNLNGIPDQCDLASGANNDCNGNGILDVCDIEDKTSVDCNKDGMPDECQFIDCNGNGILDICDITSGTSEDCNSNSVPDECEILTIDRTSAMLAPIGAGFPQNYTAVNVPHAGTDVTLTFTARGDFGSFVENVVIKINGVEMGTVFQAVGADCPTDPDVDQLIISASEFNAAVPGQNAVINMTASSSVDAHPKLCTSFIKVNIHYQGVTATDQNGNGIPDTCECLADLDGDNTVGFNDFTQLLASWGPCSPPPASCPADFDNSGDVEFNDFTFLLASWGSCP